MKEVKLLMDEGRNLYIQDGNTEYVLEVRGYNDMPHFIIKTEAELKTDKEEWETARRKETDRILEQLKSEERPWYRKILLATLTKENK
jgi:hypothetical protein